MRRMIPIVLVALMAPLSPAAAGNEAVAFERKGAQYHGPESKDAWAAMARNRDDLKKLWERYDMSGKLPIIRFEKNVAVLAGAKAPSSCSYHLHDLRLNRDRKRLLARMYIEDYDEPVACAAVVTPRTFVVAVARRDLRPPGARELRVRPRIIDDPDS